MLSGGELAVTLQAKKARNSRISLAITVEGFTIAVRAADGLFGRITLHGYVLVLANIGHARVSFLNLG
jgi:hypothetical protein